MNDGTNHFESEVLTETMQREVALAVIIPAFNAEKYLEQCVRSVITQPCKDLLIVLINDGSTDRTAEISKRLSESDNRICVINKLNGGVSSARNAGLDYINKNPPKYVAFLDSDDIWVEGFYTEEVRNIIVSGRKDLYRFSYYDGNQTLTRAKYHPIQRLAEEIPRFLPYFCSLVYRFDAIGTLRFPEGIKVQEDEVFKYVFLCTVKSWGQIDRPIFVYRSNAQSVVHDRKFDVSDKYLNNVIPAWDWAIKELQERKTEKSLRDINTCKTMQKTFLIEYIEEACKYGLSVGEINKNVETTPWSHFICDDDIWLDKRRKRFINNFRILPHLIWTYLRICHSIEEIIIRARNNDLVQNIRYPLNLCDECKQNNESISDSIYTNLQ